MDGVCNVGFIRHTSNSYWIVDRKDLQETPLWKLGTLFAETLTFAPEEGVIISAGELRQIVSFISLETAARNDSKANKGIWTTDKDGMK